MCTCIILSFKLICVAGILLWQKCVTNVICLLHTVVHTRRNMRSIFEIFIATYVLINVLSMISEILNMYNLLGC